ncbi:hypothetical protein JCM33374_g894 [Metschnikowia sp. JCM 33374]|nr:hypothetical protein JCM33374_g894 [Metschnikowia sp. JCM 33374]
MRLNIVTFFCIATIPSITAYPLGDTERTEVDLSPKKTVTTPTSLRGIHRVNTYGNSPCCTAVKDNNIKREDAVTLASIEQGFREIYNDISTFYNDGKLNTTEYELRYQTMENKAVCLLMSFLCKKFPEAEAEKGVVGMIQKVSDAFDKLTTAHYLSRTTKKLEEILEEIGAFHLNGDKQEYASWRSAIDKRMSTLLLDFYEKNLPRTEETNRVLELVERASKEFDKVKNTHRS